MLKPSDTTQTITLKELLLEKLSKKQKKSGEIE